MTFLDRYVHKQVDIREALKIAEEQNTRLASVTEIANEIFPEIGDALGTICSGTIIAFRYSVRASYSPSTIKDGFSIGEGRGQYLNLIFEIPQKNVEQGVLYLMPPGSYAAKQTKNSIRFIPKADFVPAYDFTDVLDRRFFVFRPAGSIDEKIPPIEKRLLGGKYVGPIFMSMRDGRKVFPVFFGNLYNPAEEYNFFIAKQPSRQ